MGCKPSRDAAHRGVAGSAYAVPVGRETNDDGSGRLPPPADDVITSCCAVGDSHFAASGVDGWIHFYTWQQPQLAGCFRAHRKAANRLLPLPNSALLTASADATVCLWRAGDSDILPAAVAGGDDVQQAAMKFEGHSMSVSALDLVDAGATAKWLVTGSRDCTVRAWDLETGVELQKQKVLRNVVLALRRMPETAVIAQASEDLQLRLWDLRSGLQQTHALHGGPNQLLAMDVSDDGHYVVCGSKGFSRDNCEVKVYDVRGGLRQLCAVACADQTIEVLRVVSGDKCLFASKDGFVRCLSLPEARLVSEHGPSPACCTALGVHRRSGSGPVALVAGTGPEGPRLEMLAWPDASVTQAPEILACTE